MQVSIVSTAPEPRAAVTEPSHLSRLIPANARRFPDKTAMRYEAGGAGARSLRA